MIVCPGESRTAWLSPTYASVICRALTVSHSALTGSFSVYHARRQLFLAQFCASDRPLAESRLRSQTSIVSELESMIHPGHVMVLASLGGRGQGLCPSVRIIYLCPSVRMIYLCPSVWIIIPVKRCCQVWTDADVNPC